MLLSDIISVCNCAYSVRHVQLCDPMDCSPPGCSIHGILQSRILEWVTISFTRGSSWPRDQTCISCIGREILYLWSTWEAPGLILNLDNAMPSSRGSFQPQDQTQVSRIAGRFFIVWATRETHYTSMPCFKNPLVSWWTVRPFILFGHYYPWTGFCAYVCVLISLVCVARSRISGFYGNSVPHVWRTQISPYCVLGHSYVCGLPFSTSAATMSFILSIVQDKKWYVIVTNSDVQNHILCLLAFANLV